MNINVLRPILTLFTFIVGVCAVNLAGLIDFSAQSIKDIPTHALKKVDVKESAWRIFLSHAKKDPSKLDANSQTKLEDAVAKLVDQKTGYGEVRLISQISNERGEKFHILVGEEPLFSIPGNSGLYIHLFDETGRDINSMSFDSGWRISLGSIRIKQRSEIGREVIEVDSRPHINGRDIFKQYYAMIGDKILPVRLENEKGEAVQNYYEFPNMTIGLIMKGRTSQALERSIESSDPAENLASLMWLSGKHLDLTRRSDDYPKGSIEELGDAKLAIEILSNEKLMQFSQTQVKSKNKWLRDAAKLLSKYGTEK